MKCWLEFICCSVIRTTEIHSTQCLTLIEHRLLMIIFMIELRSTLKISISELEISSSWHKYLFEVVTEMEENTSSDGRFPMKLR